MSSPPDRVQCSRCAWILLSVILALIPFVLTLLDYAIRAQYTIALAVALCVLGLLSLPSLRIYRNERGDLRRAHQAPCVEVSRRTALPILLALTLPGCGPALLPAWRGQLLV